MNNLRSLTTLFIVLLVTLLGGCASSSKQPFDYTGLLRANPASLLVMPPINDTPDVKATAGVWAQMTQPLGELGYYVLPSTLVDETLRQNGVNSATDAQEIPWTKLREFFGADAALYIKITSYGTTYQVIASATVVTLEARLIDLRTGDMLWQGKASASSAEEKQQSGGGVAGLLISAVINQIVSTLNDASFKYAGIADARLVGQADPLLPGPRSPNYLAQRDAMKIKSADAK